MPNIKQLIKDLTLEEKIELLSGFDAWQTNKIDRLGIPSIKMSDGPNGVRGDGNSGKSSACFPCAISIGSSWNLNLINTLGEELASEAKLKDVDVLLGPTINIHRHPLGGRHFECFSEDPFLTGKIAIEYVKGVQSKNIAACLKHFVGNDTEFERYTVSSNIDERTLREIYLLPFEMAIKEANAKVVMSAYNKLNNIYCSSHENLLIEILKDEWGFDGYVVSDWGAARDTVENAIGGLDLEMPGPAKSWGKNLLTAVNDKAVSENLINDKVKRILNVASFCKRFENPIRKPERDNDSKLKRKLLKDAAQEGMVLLKNDGILPLKKDIKSIGIIGPNAEKAQIIGGGSATLVPYHESHPVSSFQNNFSEKTIVKSAKGCHTYRYLPEINKSLTKENGFLVEYFNVTDNKNDFISSKVLRGSKFWIFEGFAKDIIGTEDRPDIFVKFSCTYVPDISGEHAFEIFAIGKSKLIINNEEIIDNWTDPLPGDAFFAHGSSSKRGASHLEKDKSYQIEIQYKFEGNFPAIYIGCQPPDKIDLLDEALNIAKEVDEVILLVGTNSDWETEGNDRVDFNLPGEQNVLIEKVLEINPNAIIVLNTGSPVDMPWVNKAKSILQSWYAGQEYGDALFEILTGLVNPSGKLPTTFPKRIKDTPAYSCYPGENLQMSYDEKLLIGYKWYDRKKIEPLFHFGHGLSYTNFEYSNLRISNSNENNFTCSFNIENVGDISGFEISQCYISFMNCDEDEPIKKLQGFDKTYINSGEIKKIEICLDSKSFSTWNIKNHQWEIKKGVFNILIGSSSNDIKLKDSISL
ncbi:glycoside hydrolase family 3 C-terminal domain-containing protein [Gammaproteobacteria bacterium]|nr:glycoside hydrolase family 3 C-terminal domain-containing protein [Gammaproteobacteria bacterium]